MVAALLQEADDARALAHAAPALFAMGHLMVGWLWLDQAIAAERVSRQEGAFDPSFLAGRIRACRYFAEVELPKVAAWVAPILAGSDLVLTTPEAEF